MQGFTGKEGGGGGGGEEALVFSQGVHVLLVAARKLCGDG